MITTTLNRIRDLLQCGDEWTKLLAGLGKTSADDEPLPFATILEINGLDDALWFCRAEPQYDREWRLLAVAYARRVEHLSTDPSVKDAIDVAERHANGEATNEELKNAVDAAQDAGKDIAWSAAQDAARSAARAAAKPAWAAGAAVQEAARAARWVVWAIAGASLGVTAGDAAWDAEREWQMQEFLRVVTETGASDG